MKIFEGKYLNFRQRLINWKNLVFLFFFFLYSFIIWNFVIIIDYAILAELFCFFGFSAFYIYRSKNNIHKISIDKNIVILNGETFNKKWETIVEIAKIRIVLSTRASRQGICGCEFYIKLKNDNMNYCLSSFNSFSDEELISIFNEFKISKGEKIIINEKLILNRIQEKIIKCQ